MAVSKNKSVTLSLLAGALIFEILTLYLYSFIYVFFLLSFLSYIFAHISLPLFIFIFVRVAFGMHYGKGNQNN